MTQRWCAYPFAITTLLIGKWRRFRNYAESGGSLLSLADSLSRAEIYIYIYRLQFTSGTSMTSALISFESCQSLDARWRSGESCPLVVDRVVVILCCMLR